MVTGIKSSDFPGVPSLLADPWGIAVRSPHLMRSNARAMSSASSLRRSVGGKLSAGTGFIEPSGVTMVLGVS